jgi:hypothetical protein
MPRSTLATCCSSFSVSIALLLQLLLTQLLLTEPLDRSQPLDPICDGANSSTLSLLVTGSPR